MSEPLNANRRIKAALSDAALRTADLALRQGRRVITRVDTRGTRLERVAEQLASRLRRFGERFIAKSPIPVPEVAQDAFGRMGEALGQLEHVIMSGDTSGLKANRNAGKLHAQGQVDVARQAAPEALAEGQPRSRHARAQH